MLFENEMKVRIRVKNPIQPFNIPVLITYVLTLPKVTES